MAVRLIQRGGLLCAARRVGGVPVFTTQPSFDAASYVAGATVTLSEGVVSASPSATITIEYFTLDGVDRRGELVGLTWDSTGAPAGTLAAKFRATNSQGSTLSAEITASLTAAAIVPQTATIGALTLAGAGGYQITAGGSPITNAVDAGGGTATGYTLSAAGVITPTSNGSLSAQDAKTINITCEQGSATVTLAVEPDVYSVVPNASAAGELGAVIALGPATISGKTIKGRAGNQEWVNTIFDTKAYTAETKIMSHDDAKRFTFTASNSREFRNPENMTFDGVNFNWTFIKGTSLAGNGAIVVFGPVKNLRFKNCVATGDYLNALATYGNPVAAKDYSYRGWIGKDGSTTIPLGYVYEVLDCTISEFWRSVNMPGGEGFMRFDRNKIFQCSVDHGAFADSHPNGSSVSFNRVYDPINILPNQYQVTAVDPATDQMTVATDLFGAAGGTVLINIGTDTTTPPGGTNLPGVGGANDYNCTIVSVSAGSTVLQFPVDITDAGTNVWINKEPDHADALQFIPSDGSPVNDLEIIGNMIFMSAGLDGEWPQGLFIEDISGPDIEGHYVGSIVGGNLIYTGHRNALLHVNGIDSLIADNTLITPTDYWALPRIISGDQWSWGGRENLMIKNVAAFVDGTLTNDGEIENLEISSGYAATGKFVDASTAPTDIDDFVARYSRTDLNGSIDYAAATYDLPSINNCAAIAFADVTGMDVDTYAVSGPVQVTGIVNGQGAASAYGIRASAWGGSAPQMRVTSDAAGTTIVQDWIGGSSVIVQEGQYLWVRDMSPSSYSQTRNVFVRVGRQKDNFAVATMAAPAGLIRFAAASASGDGGATLTVDLAALGVATGDLVVAGYHSANNTSRAPAFLTAGYTETAALFANDTNDSNMKLGYKLMGATPDANVQVDGTGTSTDAGVLIVQVWRGVNQTTPVDVTPVTVTGGNTRIPNPAAITPVTAGAKILVFGGAAHAEASALPLSADYLSAVTTREGVGGTYRNSALMGSVNWTSGAYDPAPFTISGDNVNDSWGAITLALRPA